MRFLRGICTGYGWCKGHGRDGMLRRQALRQIVRHDGEREVMVGREEARDRVSENITRDAPVTSGVTFSLSYTQHPLQKFKHVATTTQSYAQASTRCKTTTSTARA